MACSYTFNGKVYESYQTLVEQLDSAEIESALSILFSLKQDDVYDSIMSLKKDYKFKQWEKSNYNGIDGEPPIEIGDYMSIQQFIDSSYFMIDGEAPMFKMVFEDYLKYKKEDLVDSKHMSEEEADMYIGLMRQRWEVIAKDAYDLHRLVVSAKGKSEELTYQELSANTVGTSFQGIVDKVEEASSNIIRQVFL